jgi:hypothetical protein
MDLLVGNHKDVVKASRLLVRGFFFLEIFLWMFGCFESVSSMFCLKLLLILNLTNAKKSIP